MGGKCVSYVESRVRKSITRCQIYFRTILPCLPHYRLPTVSIRYSIYNNNSGYLNTKCLAISPMCSLSSREAVDLSISVRIEKVGSGRWVVGKDNSLNTCMKRAICFAISSHSATSCGWSTWTDDLIGLLSFFEIFRLILTALVFDVRHR